MSVIPRVHPFTDVRLCLIAKQKKCWVSFSSIYLLSVSADINQFSFKICTVEFTNHGHLMHANVAVLLHFIYDTDTFFFYASYTKNVHPVFPTYHTFHVSSYFLKWNLLLKTFPLVCKLLFSVKLVHLETCLNL